MLSIAPHWGGDVIMVPAMILPSLPAHGGPTNYQITNLPHLRDLTLANPDFLNNDPYQILLSAREYGIILREGVKRGNARESVAQCTSVGWIVSGIMEGASIRNSVQICHCTTQDQLIALAKDSGSKKSYLTCVPY